MDRQVGQVSTTEHQASYIRQGQIQDQPLNPCSFIHDEFTVPCTDWTHTAGYTSMAEAGKLGAKGFEETAGGTDRRLRDHVAKGSTDGLGLQCDWKRKE